MEARNGNDSLRTKPRSEEVMNRLMTTGFDLMHEQGYGKTGVREISSSVGVTTGTFYYYFSSKDDLISEYVSREYGRMKEGFTQLAPDDACGSIIGACSDCMGSCVEACGSEIALVLLSQSQVSSLLRVDVESLVERGVAAGDFALEEDAARLTDFILECYFGAVFAWCCGDGQGDVKDAIRRHVTIGLNHFRA